MKIKNSITCHHCGAENEYYRDTCSSCKTYLRARVFNIDLWKSIWYLVESPGKVFKEIIFAEHKNYIVFLLIAMGIKFFLNSLIISNLIYQKDNSINETPFSQVFPSGAIFAAAVLLLSYLYTKIFNTMGYRNRFKSVAAVLIYSFVPSVMILAILAPIEFALFGQHWFYANPSPISLKPGASYVLYGVEAFVYFWGWVLSIKAIRELTGNKKVSIIFGLLFSIIITAVLVLVPLMY